MAVRIYITKINCVVLARGNRWIAAWADAGPVRNGANNPGQTIVSGNSNTRTAGACCILTIFIRDVGCAVWRNTNVPVQAAARSRSYWLVHSVDGSECINGDARAKRHSAIIAARAERRNNILRTVVDRVWIRMHCRRGRSVWTSANRLVVDTGGLPG